MRRLRTRHHILQAAALQDTEHTNSRPRTTPHRLTHLRRQWTGSGGCACGPCCRCAPAAAAPCYCRGEETCGSGSIGEETQAFKACAGSCSGSRNVLRQVAATMKHQLAWRNAGQALQAASSQQPLYSACSLVARAAGVLRCTISILTTCCHSLCSCGRLPMVAAPAAATPRVAAAAWGCCNLLLRPARRKVMKRAQPEERPDGDAA